MTVTAMPNPSPVGRYVVVGERVGRSEAWCFVSLSPSLSPGAGLSVRRRFFGSVLYPPARISAGRKGVVWRLKIAKSRIERTATILVGTIKMASTALPRWIKPQLTKLIDAPPDGSGWLHEIKLDGYRMHARLDRVNVRLLTRTGLDRTHKYPTIASAVASLRAKQAYLNRDGGGRSNR